MGLEKAKYIFFTFYPAIYGPCLLWILSYIVNGYSYNILNITFGIISWIRALNLLMLLATKIAYTTLLLLLIFIEVLRISMMNMKAVPLIESLLLIPYLWSLEIVLIYIVMTYTFLKIVTTFLYIHEPQNSALDKAHNTSSSKSRGLIMITLGTCLGIHVLYSYIISVNIITIMVYVVLLMMRYRVGQISAYYSIEALLIAIPPFGIIVKTTS